MLGAAVAEPLSARSSRLGRIPPSSEAPHLFLRVHLPSTSRLGYAVFRHRIDINNSSFDDPGVPFEPASSAGTKDSTLGPDLAPRLALRTASAASTSSGRVIIIDAPTACRRGCC